MFGGKEEARAIGVNVVVGKGGFGFGGDVDGGPVGGSYGREKGDRRDRDCNGLLGKLGRYCSKHNIRDRAQQSPCLCSGIVT